MRPIHPDSTLVSLIQERPGLVPVLEHLGLDYCCGGHRRLDVAVDEAGLDLATVVRVLEGAAAGGDARTHDGWEGLGLAEMTTYVEATHHAYLHEALPRLQELANKVALVHGGAHPELVDVAALVAALRSDLEPHLTTEEQVLFPWVRRLASGGQGAGSHVRLQPVVTDLATEHVGTGHLLSQLRERAGGYAVPEDACSSYQGLYTELAALEADTHLHVHRESNVVFPAALQRERELMGTAP